MAQPLKQVVRVRQVLPSSQPAFDVDSALVDAILESIGLTYKGAESGVVRVPSFSSSDELTRVGEFFTYVLAYPPGVATPTITAVGEADAHPRRRAPSRDLDATTLVLASGGVDSTAALMHLIERGHKVVALWCDYGQPYRAPESRAVRKICDHLGIALLEATVDLSELIENDTRGFGHVIPARNFLISAIAADFNPKSIVLSGLVDELVVPDKSLRMYQEAGLYLGAPVWSPFVNISKTEILRVWRRRWREQLDVDQTVSCYNAGGDCQDCPACAKREVAKVASGYRTSLPDVFRNQGVLIEESWLPRIDTFVPERRTDLLLALSPFLDQLAPRLALKVAALADQYAQEIADRQHDLSALQDIV